MKTSKKVHHLLLALAVAIGCLCLNISAQAAPKTTTYTYDAKMGVQYETAIRQEINSTYGYSLNVYLANEGDYVASVKTNSPKLTAKITNQYVTRKSNYINPPTIDAAKDVRFKSRSTIEFYAPSAGKYSVKFTIKNKSNKIVGTKNVTVYATPYFSPVEYLSYAGQKFYSDFNTKKASGKLNYKANKTFKIKSISIGTYNADGTISYKKIKKNSKITLATKTAYTEQDYSYDNSYGDYKYAYNSFTNYDYLKPVTLVQIAYYDQLLKINGTDTYTIINVK